MERKRLIVHVDMDAFFASVEQRDDIALKGKPVIVGADPRGGEGRGVVAACSYEARRFGLHSAMPISTAFRKCPEGIYVRPDHDRYAMESRRVMEVLRRFTPDVEPISIDEAFLDITSSHHLFGSPEQTCRRIKAAVKTETDLTASLGMAPNKMTAKIASDLDKPDGLVIVTEENLLDFLHPLPVGRLWGVGIRFQEHLREFGIRTIGDLARQNREDFIQRFGKSGLHTWELANGIDPREIQTEESVKSVGNEFTFDRDTKDKDAVLNTLMGLSEKVCSRMRERDLKGRTVILKIRFSDFSTHTRSSTMPSPSNFADLIYRMAADSLESFDIGRRPVRLIGVQVTRLESGRQLDLFTEEADPDRKKEHLHRALDEIKSRFGAKAIHRRR